MPASLVKKLVGTEIWNNYFKICVIRNPFDKIVSFWWFHLSELERDTLCTKDFSYIKNCFRDWILSSKIFPIDNFIYKIDDAVCIDYFIRFENLQNDLITMIHKLSLSSDISTLKKYKSESRKKNNHFSEYYDQESIKIINRLFGWEIEYFNYSCE